MALEDTIRIEVVNDSISTTSTTTTNNNVNNSLRDLANEVSGAGSEFNDNVRSAAREIYDQVQAMNRLLADAQLQDTISEVTSDLSTAEMEYAYWLEKMETELGRPLERLTRETEGLSPALDEAGEDVLRLTKRLLGLKGSLLPDEERARLMAIASGEKIGNPTTAPNSDGGKSLVSKVGLAVLGVRSIYFAIRRIVSQNEALTQAVSNLFVSLGNALKPILDVIAVIINWIAGIIGKIFKVGTKTSGSAGAIARSLASFDEIENIGSSGGGGGIGVSDDLDKAEGKIKRWLKDLLDRLLAVGAFILEVIGSIGAAVLIAENSIVLGIAGVVAGIVGVVKGVVDTIIGIVKYLFSDGEKSLRGLWAVIKESFSEGFHSIWDDFDSTFLQPAKEMFLELWDYLKAPFETLKYHLRIMLNNMISGVGDVIDVLNKIPGINITKPSYIISDAAKGAPGKISSLLYANGGFPTSGQLFIANEAGPELVGTIGSHTAVANNDQIIEGIKQGVMEAMNSTKNTVVINLDGRTIAKSTLNQFNQMSREMGVAIV